MVVQNFLMAVTWFPASIVLWERHIKGRRFDHCGLASLSASVSSAVASLFCARSDDPLAPRYAHAHHFRCTHTLTSQHQLHRTDSDFIGFKPKPLFHTEIISYTER
jgi:hypothetical protein